MKPLQRKLETKLLEEHCWTYFLQFLEMVKLCSQFQIIAVLKSWNRFFLWDIAAESQTALDISGVSVYTDISTPREVVLHVDWWLHPCLLGHLQEDVGIQARIRRYRTQVNSEKDVLSKFTHPNVKFHSANEILFLIPPPPFRLTINSEGGFFYLFLFHTTSFFSLCLILGARSDRNTRVRGTKPSSGDAVNP